MHVAIVGAGPAGLYTAYKLAELGHQITVYEEHDTIGAPIQCTGLLTEDIEHFFSNISKQKCVDNVSIRLSVAAGKESIEVKSREYVVNRTLFDQFIGDLAQKKGVSVKTSHRCSFSNSDVYVLDKKTGKKSQISPDILIGADGPLSKVAQQFFVGNAVPLYIAMQAVVKGNFDQQLYETYLGSEFPEFFGWVVPENKERARIGLGTLQNGDHVTKQLFDDFLIRLGHSKEDILSWQSGPIPIFNPWNTWYVKQKQTKGNHMHVFLVGDAAGQVKSTTGGGIIPHLRCIDHLASTVKKNKFWLYRPSLFRDSNLYMHLFIRKTLDLFDDGDYQKLLKIVQRPQIIKTLETITRDRAVKLVSRLLLYAPDLCLFMPKAIRGGIRMWKRN